MRAAIHQGQVDYTKVGLQVCLVIKLVQDNHGAGIPLKAYHNTHSCAVRGLVVGIGYAFQHFIPHQLFDLLDDVGCVDAVWNLGEH